MNTATPTSRAGRREWLGLGVLALACMLSTMDLTVLFLALPKISADLHPSSTEMLWITDSALRSTGSTWGTPRFALETRSAARRTSRLRPPLPERTDVENSAAVSTYS